MKVVPEINFNYINVIGLEKILIKAPYSEQYAPS